MAQDEMDETAEAAVPRHRYLLVAGVAGACALGVGLGLWARPAISERGGAKPVVQAEAAPAGQRKLKIVFDDAPAAPGTPLEVMAPHPQAGPPLLARLAPTRPVRVAAAPAEPVLPTRPPPGLAHADVPREAEPVLGDRAPPPSFARRAAPLAHSLIASAEAALLRIAEIKPEAPPPQATPAIEPEPKTVAAPKRPDPVKMAEQRKRARAERLARLEARKAAQAQAKAEEDARIEAAAQAKAERPAAQAAAKRRAERLAEKTRAERLARIERRKAARLAAQERAREKAAALAEARAEARARAVAEAKAAAEAKAVAEAKAEKAEARRKNRLAVLAHAAIAKVAPHHAKPPPEPPAKPLRTSPLRLASAPRCASSDPGEALSCADPQLSAAERRMNRAYQQAQAAGVPEADLRRQQQRWLAARAAAAKEAPWAVRDVYQARIAELEDMARGGHN